MAEVLPDALDRTIGETGFIGASIVDVVTAGLYDNPLMVYREYLQNSVDAIDAAVEEDKLAVGDGYVKIDIDSGARRIEIEDNGTGVANDCVELRLGSVGYSDKREMATRRGFRGIGRLGGLGYCDEVTFETRSCAAEDVAVVKWNGEKLRSFIADRDHVSAEAAVQAACAISFREADPETPTHFFRVTLSGVRAFREDSLLRETIVRDYLSQIGPVPFDHSRFPHAQKIESRLSELSSYATYSVSLGDQPIYKPYSDRLIFKDGFSDTVEDVEFFEFKSPESETTAIGWYGITNLLGTIPKEMGVSGIRVRSGNIQVGSDYALADHFAESRFAGWHLGEIHVANGGIQPNARRDGFEQSREYESFLEYASLLGRVLSKQCREASEARGTVRAAKTALTKLENLLMNTSSRLGPSHLEVLTRKADRLLCRVEEIEQQANLSSRLLQRLNVVRKRRRELEHLPKLTSCIAPEAVQDKAPQAIIEEICWTVMEEYSEASSAEDLIAKITAQFRNGQRSGNEE